MDRERLLVLKSSPIGDHGSLLQAHIYSNNGLRSRRQSFLDSDLNADVPVPGLTGHRRTQNLDLMTEHLFAPVPFLGRERGLPFLDKAQLFRKIDCPELAPQLSSSLLDLLGSQQEATESRDGEEVDCPRRIYR